MKISIPKEIKDNEFRVAITPGAVNTLTLAGHEVYIEEGAGISSGFTDEEYKSQGAKIVDQKTCWEVADMIYKVKEPLKEEYKFFREGLIIFCYLHLAANEELTKELLKNKVTGVAFETVEVNGKLPLLRPMSEIAGRMAITEGSFYLSKQAGGKGILLDGVPGVAPAHVVIIGTGGVGRSAVKVATGMGARVTAIGHNMEQLSQLIDIFGNSIETLYSDPYNISKAVESADLVISTVLVPGSKAPCLVTEEMVKSMGEGSVIVDVAIDQGGSIETTKNHPTTHSNPTFVKHGVIHYAVANIPGSVPMTSTKALSNATSEFANLIAKDGIKKAMENHGLKLGINTMGGFITNAALAKVYEEDCKDPEELI
ncbi:alanine dehydrogenase [Peptoniphilus duerdenii]|uniref:alanine dehydrogenase n=1 Tax=Peptoniphilus duerdenii TaxID=507750 RepID=UPI0023F014E6|nr:alanine dehydrogenase [Peptoniphilus duerdenii]